MLIKILDPVNFSSPCYSRNEVKDRTKGIYFERILLIQNSHNQNTLFKEEKLFSTVSKAVPCKLVYTDHLKCSSLQILAVLCNVS